MTRSLPGVTRVDLSPVRASLRGPRGRRAVAAATGATFKVLPHLSDRAKRMLAGGRSLTIEGNTLDPMLNLLRLAQRATGAQGLSVDDDVAITRTEVRSLAEMLGGKDIGGPAEELTIPGPAGPIRARHYRPADTRDAPILVFYHGGGFVIGDLDVYEGPCRLICRDAGVHVVSVDYRLAPEYKAPAALDDAYAAYLWVREHAAELGADPLRVAVGGDSAGGNLAAGVARRARTEGVQPPNLQFLIYPVTEMGSQKRSRTLFAEGFFLSKHDMDWFENTYLSGSGVEPTDPRVSPLLTDDLSGLPAALLVTAGFDPLRDEGDSYAAALQAAGVAVDHRRFGSMTHLFINYATLGGGCASAMSEVCSALRAHLARA